MRTLRQKIFIGYGASRILAVLIPAWAMFMMLRLGRASESILRNNYRSIQAAEHMIDAIERQDSAILLYLLGYQWSVASGKILMIDELARSMKPAATKRLLMNGGTRG